MSSYLRIRVRFLCGYYHGEEWPPSPLRLMQALVAGSAHAGTLERDEPALAWLEGQEPPTIHAPRARPGPEFTAYVPRNSDDIALRDLYKGTPRYEVFAKRRARYDGQDTRRRWVSGSVTYEWCVRDTAHAAQLGLLSHTVGCLGRAEDLAFATFELSGTRMHSDSIQWRPSPRSSFMRNPLRVPLPGSLSSFAIREQARRARIESKEFVDPSVIYDELSYDPGGAESPRPFLVYDLHGLDPGSWLSWRHDDGVTVAAMIRHALANRIPERWKGYAIGHVGNGDPDDRLSWIPLPSIGHTYADGRIRRAMLLTPRGESPDSHRFREIQHAMAHAPLIRYGKQVGTMNQTDEISESVRRGYLGTSAHWHTVTPVVTHGKTTRGTRQKGKFDPRKAEKLILRALGKAGLPQPVDMRFQAAPHERSGRAAREYRVPRHLSGLSRFHVSVTFPEPISGPILVGVGRHYGLGLFSAR